jgi:thymidylate synthase
MLTPTPFGNFTAAYLAVLRQIHSTPDYRTAGRGKSAWESTNISFRILEPHDRIAYLRARRANIAFNFAESLWYLSGRDDLEMIGYYAPGLARFSADGITLTGTAYGPRLFGHTEPDGRSQFDRVLDLLRDRDSKRATMMIMRPDELVDPANPDVACTLGLQFMLRDGRLHLTTYMRGNDAMIGLLGDAFSFTFIQEFAARRLGVPVGSYTHHVGSMHINVFDVDRVAAMLAEADESPAGPFPVEEMPATSDADLALILLHEQALRTNQAQLTPDTAAQVPLAGYWQKVLLVFEAYRQITHTTEPVDSAVAAALHPGHRWLLAARWPDRITSGVEAGQPA